MAPNIKGSSARSRSGPGSWKEECKASSPRPAWAHACKEHLQVRKGHSNEEPLTRDAPPGPPAVYSDFKATQKIEAQTILEYAHSITGGGFQYLSYSSEPRTNTTLFHFTKCLAFPH